MFSLSKMSALHLAHALGIAPLFIYVGLYKEAVPEHVFTALGVLGIIVLAYHSYRAYGKLKENQSAWINWIHIFLVAPLLLILGYLKKDANSRYFEMMMLLGFASLGYHGFYLIRDSMVI